MSRVLITGSADGLGLAAARLLTDQGHRVVGHARTERRAHDLREAVPEVEAVIVGDVSTADQTRAVAEQANQLGRFNAVIHNVGIGYREPRKIVTEDGHAHVLAINVLAPYLLTALMTPPHRLVYLSSGMQRGGSTALDDLDWNQRHWDGAQAYSDSKLFDATLSAAVARLWPEVLSNAVEPGWVPTKMGGAGAPDDLTLAPVTQAWLAISPDPAATVSGQYFYHRRQRDPHPAVTDHAFQDALLHQLSQMTGVDLPPSAGLSIEAP